MYYAAAIGPQVGGLKVSCRIAKLHPNFVHFHSPSYPSLRHEKTWFLRQLTEASIFRVRPQRRKMPSQFMYRSDGNTLLFSTNSAKVPCHEHDGTIPAEMVPRVNNRSGIIICFYQSPMAGKANVLQA